MSKESNRKKVSHRDFFLRPFIDLFGGSILRVMKHFHEKNYLSGTTIARKLDNSEPLTADDITLSQLELTVRMCNTLSSGNLYPEFRRDYMIVNLLDGMDGPYARHLGPTSPEGAMKDAIVDRLCDTVMAKHIARERSNFNDGHENLEKNLTTSFQLSTLSKAACEMCGVRTSEGGMGSMYERRRKLFRIIRDLYELRLNDQDNDELRTLLINRVDSECELLMGKSYAGAIERIDKMAKAIESGKASWDSSELYLPDSNPAAEARKYAAVVLMNRKIDIDSVDVLNKLAGGKIIFPAAEALREKHVYIPKSMQAIDNFYQEALRIANVNSSLY